MTAENNDNNYIISDGRDVIPAGVTGEGRVINYNNISSVRVGAPPADIIKENRGAADTRKIFQ